MLDILLKHLLLKQKLRLLNQKLQKRLLNNYEDNHDTADDKDSVFFLNRIKNSESDKLPGPCKLIIGDEARSLYQNNENDMARMIEKIIELICFNYEMPQYIIAECAQLNLSEQTLYKRSNQTLYERSNQPFMKDLINPL